jgi:hypothetical protein
MNTNIHSAAAMLPDEDASWPLSKRAILATCLLVPMAGGLALYILYRRSAPAAAAYANRVTLRALGIVLALAFIVGMLAAAVLPRRPASHDRHVPVAAPPR